MGIFDATQSQQAALRGAAGLGGMFGGLQGIGQASRFRAIDDSEDRIRAFYHLNTYKAVKTFRDELQEETNEWLKDIKGE